MRRRMPASRAADRLRSHQLFAERADGGARAAAGQQPDHIAAEPSQMLINQARNLASLPYSSLQQLAAVDQPDPAAAGPGASASPTTSADRSGLLDHLRARIDEPVQPIVDRRRASPLAERGGRLSGRHARPGAVVGNLDTNRTQMSALVAASQGATGALQATQAGNQLLALQTQQLADLTATIAAQGGHRAWRRPSGRLPRIRRGSSSVAS